MEERISKPKDRNPETIQVEEGRKIRYFKSEESCKSYPNLLGRVTLG